MSSTVPRRAVPRPHGEPSRPGRRLRQSNASSVEPKATQALLLTVRGRCRKGCDQFQSLTPGQVKIPSQKRWVSRRKLQVLATRLADGELLILVTDSRPQTALRDYARRWGIETLFAALKTRGFNLEATHFRDSHKLGN